MRGHAHAASFVLAQVVRRPRQLGRVRCRVYPRRILPARPLLPARFARHTTPFQKACSLRMITTWSVSSDTVRVPGTGLCIDWIPLFQDNYSYVLRHADSGDSVVVAVDPADAPTFLGELQRRFDVLAPTHVLTTHKHWDHAGGNAELARRIPSLTVYGSAAEDIPARTHPVRDGDVFDIGQSALQVRVLSTPCHTRGHVCYYVRDRHAAPDAPGVAFTGDTLFVGGCGRFFEGTGEQMLQAMRKLAALPPDTLVFCGHEYTVKNLEFAATVDADNQAVQRKLAEARTRRAASQPTVPSTIGGEQQWNVFMRASDAVEMDRLREMKNRL